MFSSCHFPLSYCNFLVSEALCWCDYLYALYHKCGLNTWLRFLLFLCFFAILLDKLDLCSVHSQVIIETIMPRTIPPMSCIHHFPLLISILDSQWYVFATNEQIKILAFFWPYMDLLCGVKKFRFIQSESAPIQCIRCYCCPLFQLSINF